MALISLRNIELGFGGAPLLDKAGLQIEAGERIGLVGRNGVGKSSLMKVINGEISPDKGSLVRQRDIRVGHLSQEVPDGLKGSIYALVASGLGAVAAPLVAYRELNSRFAENGDEDLLDQLNGLQQELEVAGAWGAHLKVEKVLSRLDLAGNAELGSLSGGVKRRAMLAASLVEEPNLLMLDEPTNHLDIDTVSWLEGFLLEFPGALLFTSHDRLFMDKLSTRIVELDRGVL